MVTKNSIREAYLFLRKENQSIPSETLEFMKEAALAKLDEQSEVDLHQVSDIDVSEFVGQAVLSKVDNVEVVALQGDGVMISADNESPCDFRLSQGSRYKVTLTKLD